MKMLFSKELIVIEYAHKWTPVIDLPDSYLELRDEKFNEIANKWLQIKENINKDVLKDFTEKIKREWAIEIGQIENLYFLNDKITETLIQEGLLSIDLPHQATVFDLINPKLVISSNKEVMDQLYTIVAQNYPINDFLVRSLHAIFVEHQNAAIGIDPTGKYIPIALSKGVYKRWPNNPRTSDGSVFEYCPPEQVQSELDRLFGLHREHVERGVPVEIEAAWLHHQFVLVHPFQDGNGRMARALASLLYIKAGFFPPIVKLSDKNNYINALDHANDGELKPLVSYLSGLVRTKLELCLSIYSELKD
jgi:hypothetical protein